jgi:hypothetical protein
MTGIETVIEQRESWRAVGWRWESREARGTQSSGDSPILCVLAGRAELHHGLLERVGWECGSTVDELQGVRSAFALA